MKKAAVGDGKVMLVAGGGKVYTDVAARFVSSEKSIEETISVPYNADIVTKIINSGHLATTEFDFFIFAVEGYSRVTEVQLVRKRHAAYMIKAGGINKHGKREFSVVLPEGIDSFFYTRVLKGEDICLPSGRSLQEETGHGYAYILEDSDSLLESMSDWYDRGVKEGIEEGKLRYLKPLATEFKGLIGMNAHALLDFFAIRCCMKAADEIRDMAFKMLRLCKEISPDLFANAGANCIRMGYCPENTMQHEKCQNRIITKDKALEVLKTIEWKT